MDNLSQCIKCGRYQTCTGAFWIAAGIEIPFGLERVYTVCDDCGAVEEKLHSQRVETNLFDPTEADPSNPSV